MFKAECLDLLVFCFCFFCVYAINRGSRQSRYETSLPITYQQNRERTGGKVTHSVRAVGSKNSREEKKKERREIEKEMMKKE
jgi:hypothetical protein